MDRWVKRIGTIDGVECASIFPKDSDLLRREAAFFFFDAIRVLGFRLSLTEAIEEESVVGDDCIPVRIFLSHYRSDSGLCVCVAVFHRSGVAAPAVVQRIRDEFCPKWVEINVGCDDLERGRSFYDEAFEARFP